MSLPDWVNTEDRKAIYGRADALGASPATLSDFDSCSAFVDKKTRMEIRIKDEPSEKRLPYWANNVPDAQIYGKADALGARDATLSSRAACCAFVELKSKILALTALKTI